MGGYQPRDDHSARRTQVAKQLYGGTPGASGKPSSDPSGESSDSAGDSSRKEDKWILADRVFGPLLSEDYSEAARSALSGAGSVVGALEAAVAILEPILTVINTLQSDANSWYRPLKVTAELLLDELRKTLASFASTGVYVLPVLPAELALGDIYASKKVSGVPLSSALVSATEAVTGATGGSTKKVAGIVSDVSRAATRKSDPNRPVFDNKGDYVGGVIFFLDSQESSLADITKDIQALLRLFGKVLDVSKFRVKPAKNLSATAAMVQKRATSMISLEGDSDWSSLLRATVEGGNHYPAIQLSWDLDDMVALPGITGWHVYRLTTPYPPVKYVKEKGETVPVTSNGVQVLDYTDVTFNGGKPVYVSYLNRLYTDFEVQPGVTYYYWVTAAFRTSIKDEFKDVEPFSNMATATAVNCIPRSAEIPIVQTPAGFMDGPLPDDPPYWHNLSLRDLMGEEIDTLFQSLYRTLKRLFASAETSSDHHEGIIRLLEEKLAQLRAILDMAKGILDSLETLKFSTSSWTLGLEPREGGMDNFLKRMKNAKVPKQEALESSGVCSIYAAVVLLVGWPGGGTASNLNLASGSNAVNKSSQETLPEVASNLRSEVSTQSILKTILSLLR